MKEEILQLRTKSERSLKAARDLHEKGDHDFAVSRAYYALFYTAEALLLMKGKTFSKHSAVITAFYQCYVADGALDKKYHQILNKAFDLRNDADYLITTPISRETSETQLLLCDAFMKETEKLFK